MHDNENKKLICDCFITKKGQDKRWINKNNMWKVQGKYFVFFFLIAQARKENDHRKKAYPGPVTSNICICTTGGHNGCFLMRNTELDALFTNVIVPIFIFEVKCTKQKQ